MNIDIYADGSCMYSNTENVSSGWAFVVVDGTTKEDIFYKRYGKLRRGRQTNNRGELEAVLQALIYIDRNRNSKNFYTIYSDSAIAVNGISKNGSRLLNRDIWSQIEILAKKNLGKFTIKYIESKSNELNIAADTLAKIGANSLLIAPTKVKSIV